MKLVLRNVNGETISLEVMPGDTFSDLKARMQEKSGIVLDLEQLKYKGKKITDDQIITQYFAEDVNDLSDDDAADDNSVVEDLLDGSLMVACSVPGCNNTALTSPEKTFFRFPMETNRCQHWLLLCKRLDLLDKPSAYVSQQHVVCQDHFVVDQLMSTPNGLKLKYGAVPTIIDAHYLVDGTVNEHDEIITDETKCIVPIKSEPNFEYSEEDDDIVSDLEDSYEVASHPGLLCRLCASHIGDMVETGEIVYIFSSAAKDQDIAHRINMCLPVTVKSTDPLPKQLCMQCLEKLNICHEFAESCLQAEKKLCNLSKERSFKSSPTKNEPDSDEKTNYKSKVGSKSFAGTEMSCDTDKNNALSYCCPLCCDGNMANPKESKESDIIGEIQKMDGIVNAHPKTGTEGGPDDGRKINAEETFGLPTDPLYRKSNNNLTCRMCAGAFESLESCLEHAKSHASTGVLPCSLCDLAFYNEPSLDSHWKAHEREKVPCATCHRRVSRADSGSHTCGGNRPHRCPADGCGKWFRSAARLDFHAGRVHGGGGGGPAACHVCDKTFARETNLFEHVRMVHERERPFVCATCGKAFQLRGRLMAHARVHTGERPFECDLCGGRFYNSATLKGREFIECQQGDD